jgi:hypothetical protein
VDVADVEGVAGVEDVAAVVDVADVAEDAAARRGTIGALPNGNQGPASRPKRPQNQTPLLRRRPRTSIPHRPLRTSHLHPRKYVGAFNSDILAI